MINWLVSPSQTNDSLANKRERSQALLLGLTFHKIILKSLNLQIRYIDIYLTLLNLVYFTFVLN